MGICGQDRVFTKQEYNFLGIKILWQDASGVAVGGEFDSVGICRDENKKK